MINSLCIIPETKCYYNCDYCYEKYKKYNTELEFSEFIIAIKNNIDKYKSTLKEFIIDYNGVMSLSELHGYISYLSLYNLPIIINTNIIGLINTIVINDRVKWNISIHEKYDIHTLFYLMDTFKLKINMLNIMKKDLEWVDLKLFNLPYYIIINKFSDEWLNKPIALNYINIDLKYRDDPLCNIDNCLLTNIHNMECPASTQINIYRDGSIRRCPYENEISKDESIYNTGCKLRKGNNEQTTNDN